LTFSGGGSLLRIIKEFVTGTKGQFLTLKRDLVGNSIIPDMMVGIERAMGNSFASILISAGIFIGQLESIFRNAQVPNPIKPATPDVPKPGEPPVTPPSSGSPGVGNFPSPVIAPTSSASNPYAATAGAVSATFREVQSITNRYLDDILPNLWERFVNNIIKLVQFLNDKLVGHSIIPDMMKDIENVMGTVLDRTLKNFSDRVADMGRQAEEMARYTAKLGGGSARGYVNNKNTNVYYTNNNYGAAVRQTGAQDVMAAVAMAMM
jgi:hypothetical protein